MTRATELGLALVIALAIATSTAEAQDIEPERPEAAEPVEAEPPPAEPPPAEPVEAERPPAAANPVVAQPLEVGAPVIPAEPVVPQPELIGVGPAMPVSTDPGGYPPVRPAPRPRPYVELHGFAALWVVPVTDEAAPQHAADTFRLRWAIVRLDAHPVPELHILTRVGLMLPNPLLDLSISWTALPFLNVTFGQFRLPLGASATTLGPQLVMVDRPAFVYAMTKATFRDLGAMIGTGEEGLAGGVLHYRAAVVSGNGRVLEGDPTVVTDARDLLWVARAIVDFGPLIAPALRLALGGEVAWTRDPALDTTDLPAARARAVNLLGRVWTPIDRERETMLAGADLTFSMLGMWAQAEWLFLESKPTDGTPSRRATGASLELAYTLPWRIEETVAFQLAARGELVDPDLDRARDEQGVLTGGLNVLPLPYVRLSVFGGALFYQDAAGGGDRLGGELTLRAAVGW